MGKSELERFQEVVQMSNDAAQTRTEHVLEACMAIHAKVRELGIQVDNIRETITPHETCVMTEGAEGGQA